jgi:hypothetical protein
VAQWLACAAHNRKVGGSKPPSERSNWQCHAHRTIASMVGWLLAQRSSVLGS